MLFNIVTYDNGAVAGSSVIDYDDDDDEEFMVINTKCKYSNMWPTYISLILPHSIAMLLLNYCFLVVNLFSSL